MGNSQGKPVEFDGEGTDQPNPLLLLYNRPRSRPRRSSCLVSRCAAFASRSSQLTCSVWKLVNLNHFRLLRVVGRGAFGKVRIVERKDTNLSFALKYIRKDEGAQQSTWLLTVPRSVHCLAVGVTDIVGAPLQSFDPNPYGISSESVACSNM